MTTHNINHLELLGRRVMPGGRQRAYFLTPNDTVVYYDAANGAAGSTWHHMPFSIIAMLDMIEGWNAAGKWHASFAFWHRESQLRARLGLPERFADMGDHRTQIAQQSLGV